jgi:quercetin dioxygenase-like cupin family protein
MTISTEERLWIVGDTMTFKATGEDTAGRLLVLENISTPGGGPPLHVHHVEEESFYVLDGVFEIIRGEERIAARAGDLVHVPPGTPHRFSNVGEEPARMLIWFSPAGIEGFFREAGTPAVGDGPPPPVSTEEIARTQRAAPRYGLELV